MQNPKPRNDLNFDYDTSSNAPAARNDVNFNAGLPEEAMSDDNNPLTGHILSGPIAASTGAIEAFGTPIQSIATTLTKGINDAAKSPIGADDVLHTGAIPAKLLSRALLKITGEPELRAVNPLSPATYNNPVANSLAGNQADNPWWNAGGKLAGSIGATLPLNAISPLSAGTTALSKLGAFAGNQALQGGMATYLLNPNASSGQIAAGAAISPVLGGLGNLIANSGSRFSNVLNASAQDLKDKASQMYNSVYKAADNAGFSTTPTTYGNYAKDILNQLNTSGNMAAKQNAPLKDLLQDAVSDVNSGNPNIFSLQNTHEQFKTLDDAISKYVRSGDANKARIVATLKTNLTNDLDNSMSASGNPDLYKQFKDTQAFYANQVVPIMDNPTGKKEIIGDIGAMTALSGLPHPLATGLTAAMGEHGLQKSGILNLFKRFGSRYDGGMGSLLNSLNNPSINASSNVAAANLAGLGGNQ